MITQEELKKEIYYNPIFGDVKWRRIRKGRYKKWLAGFETSDRYHGIFINGCEYKIHRLIFLYMKGYLPENLVDHKNQHRQDNRWNNLREVSTICNNRNSKICKNNKSGITGVCWSKLHNKWSSQIKVNYVKYHLGLFKNFDEAVEARWDAEVKYDWSNCQTNSPAYNYLKNKGLI